MSVMRFRVNRFQKPAVGGPVKQGQPSGGSVHTHKRPFGYVYLWYKKCALHWMYVWALLVLPSSSPLSPHTSARPQSHLPAAEAVPKEGTSSRRHHERAHPLSQFLNPPPLTPPTQWVDNQPPHHASRMPSSTGKQICTPGSTNRGPYICKRGRCTLGKGTGFCHPLF